MRQRIYLKITCEIRFIILLLCFEEWIDFEGDFIIFRRFIEQGLFKPISIKISDSACVCIVLCLIKPLSKARYNIDQAEM